MWEGGYSATLRFGLSDNFHWGWGGVGILYQVQNRGILKLGLSDNFHWGVGGGGILPLPDLDSDNFHLGGYSATLGFELSDNFHWGGGFCHYRIGVNCRIWTKISTTPAGSCITDSLSHTTYVETNYYQGFFTGKDKSLLICCYVSLD